MPDHFIYVHTHNIYIYNMCMHTLSSHICIYIYIYTYISSRTWGKLSWVRTVSLKVLRWTVNWRMSQHVEPCGNRQPGYGMPMNTFLYLHVVLPKFKSPCIFWSLFFLCLFPAVKVVPLFRGCSCQAICTSGQHDAWKERAGSVCSGRRGMLSIRSSHISPPGTHSMTATYCMV